MSKKSDELVDELEGLISEHTEDTTPVEKTEPKVESKDVEVSDEPTEFKVPDKFKDKSLEDVIRSYQELEKFNGRQAQEVGQLRKAVDELFNKELEMLRSKDQGKAQERKKLESDDLFNDPDTAITNRLNDILEEKLRPVQESLGKREVEDRQRQFTQKHPDYQEIGQSSEFIQWVQANERRLQKFQKANDQYDWDTADELLSDYKERLELTKEIRERQKEKNADDLRKAEGTPSRGGEGKGKPTFSRQALIDLRWQNPERYKQLYPQILEAYKEGRVR